MLYILKKIKIQLEKCIFKRYYSILLSKIYSLFKHYFKIKKFIFILSNYTSSSSSISL